MIIYGLLTSAAKDPIPVPSYPFADLCRAFPGLAQVRLGGLDVSEVLLCGGKRHYRTLHYRCGVRLRRGAAVSGLFERPQTGLRYGQANLGPARL
jgi:hypothetical protein